MNILILNWRDTMNPLGGGAEISLFEHAKYWQKKGAQVVWFTGSFEGSKRREVHNGIIFIRKGSAYTVHLWGFFYYLTGKLGNPDLVIDCFHGIPFFSPLYLPRKKIIALINEIAGKLWFLNTPFFIAFLGFHLEPLFLNLYKNNPFITGSESARKELIHVGIPSNTISVVHHGVHLQHVSAKIQKEKVPTILYLGRVSTDKGIHDAVIAFCKIKKNIPDAILWIAGGEEKPGILSSFLEKVDKEVQQSIKYFGFISEQKKFELIKRAWVLLHPSYKEGWGLTVIEAASEGVPTVGYDVAGLQDSVQNGKTGILVPLKNIAMLGKAVESVIKEKKKYQLLSKNAKTWSNRFTWENSVTKSWQIIHDIYENNKKNQ